MSTAAVSGHRRVSRGPREVPLSRAVQRPSAEDQMRLDFERQERMKNERTRQANELVQWYKEHSAQPCTSVGAPTYIGEASAVMPVPNTVFLLVVGDPQLPMVHALEMVVRDLIATMKGDRVAFTASPCRVQDGQVLATDTMRSFCYDTQNECWLLNVRGGTMHAQIQWSRKPQ